MSNNTSKKRDLKIRAYQSYDNKDSHVENLAIDLNVQFVSGDGKAFDKATGTACNELFHFAELCRRHKTKGLAFSKPIHLSVECDGEQIVDTIQAAKHLKAKLKLRNNAQSKKSFALVFFDICREATRKIDIKTQSDVVREITGSEVAVLN